MVHLGCEKSHNGEGRGCDPISAGSLASRSSQGGDSLQSESGQMGRGNFSGSSERSPQQTGSSRESLTKAVKEALGAFERFLS